MAVNPSLPTETSSAEFGLDTVEILWSWIPRRIRWLCPPSPSTPSWLLPLIHLASSKKPPRERGGSSHQSRYDQRRAAPGSDRGAIAIRRGLDGGDRLPIDSLSPTSVDPCHTGTLK